MVTFAETPPLPTYLIALVAGDMASGPEELVRGVPVRTWAIPRKKDLTAFGQEAAAAVLTTDGHAGKVYELAGDTAFTMAELAAVVGDLAHKPVAYTDMPEAAYREALVGFGLPAAFAGLLADSDTGITRGELDDTSGDLRRLIGRPTTPLRTAVAAALA